MDTAGGPVRVGSPSDAELPIPRRFWWLKRSPIFLLAPVLVLAAARSCSLYLADRQFAREIQSLRDRGEPVDLSAFRQAPVPASEDAAPLLRQAALAVSSSYRASTKLTVEQWVGQNANALALTRHARGLVDAYWGDGLADPLDQVVRANQFQLRELERLLSRAADVAAHRDDPRGVIDYMRDSLHVARLIERAPDPLSQEIATAWQMAVTGTLDGDSPAMIERDLTGTTRGGNDSLVTSTRLLIGELLDPADLPDFRRLVRGIRARTIFLMTDPRVEQEGWFYLHKPNPWEKFLLFAFRAKIQRSDLQYLRYVNGSEHSSVFAALPRLVEEDPMRIDVVAFRLSTGHSDLWGMPIFCAQAVARRRLAAIGLAIRLYQHEHDGKYPGSLDELVPKYLPEIPRDPFDRANGPLRMSRSGPLRVYSAGFNGRDVSFGLEHPLAPIPQLHYSPPPRRPRQQPTSQAQPTSRPDH